MKAIKENPIRYIKLFSVIFLAATAVLRILYTMSPDFKLSSLSKLNVMQFIEFIPFILFLVFAYFSKDRADRQALMSIAFGTAALYQARSTYYSLTNVFDSINHLYNDTAIMRLGANFGKYLLAVFMLGIYLYWTVDCLRKNKNTTKSRMFSLILLFCALAVFGFSLFMNLLELRNVLVYPSRKTQIILSFVFSTSIGITRLFAPLTYFVYWTFLMPKKQMN